MTRPDDEATMDLGDNCDEPRDCTNFRRATFGGATVAEAPQLERPRKKVAITMKHVVRFTVGSISSD